MNDMLAMIIVYIIICIAGLWVIFDMYQYERDHKRNDKHDDKSNNNQDGRKT